MDRPESLEAKKVLAKMGGDGHNPDAGFFEGAEKLFECWFDASTEGFVSLRTIPRDKIDWLLTIVKCTVISMVKGECFDAYVLSESSLFVFDEFLVLKTCGTTTLLHFVPAFLRLAAERCRATQLLGLWYSRKNMVRPELQIGPHQSFEAEAQFLDELLEETGYTGGAYVLGRLNGDHWNLYTLDMPEWDSEVELTFELLMSDLDPAKMQHFYCAVDEPDLKARGKQCTQESGIAALLGDVEVIDEAMFQPCGYSMNALRQREYYTIHVTPQPECSYASFETNRRYDNYDEVIHQLIEIFRPGRFIVNITSQNAEPNVSKKVDGFLRRDWVSSNFGQYSMHMGHYVQATKYTRNKSLLKLLSVSPAPSPEPQEEE